MSQRFSSSTAFHLFADDMQGTGGGKPARVNDVATKLGVCLLAISNSCAAKRLQLNTKKSEVTWFGSATNLANFHRLIYTSKSDLTMYAALDWFASYFGDRTQQVITGTDSSSVSQLLVGTPQGSVLGPKCFDTYADVRDADVREIRSSTVNSPPCVITDRPVAELLKQFNP